ncbi:alpha/beta hydrolase-fold protein [Flavobacterium orientale]|uniref:Phosphonate ABC transporter ATP-binding protein n=1 Tax=Flavobacterium orientale TaxID=1756020 RepID=A0A917DC77_9FLAO|nr:alpha/beta hydrolase-fold protein [Flavobacterium orientale]GGD25879.1 phosphonate ABC transporter ATP-binding protein [Flavobacterium orientale]
MRKYYFLLGLFLPLIGFSQVTLRVTSIPTNTPAGASIYFAGATNGWNAGDPNAVLQPDGFGAYEITIPQGTGTVEYKFTRGSWPTVEGNASGGFLPNRSFTFTDSPQTINLTIQSWEDISGSGSNSTAAANVQILSPSFFIPQLNRNRRIWLYLPPDYHTTTKTYPVLYMKDGQNLFDNATSFAGEWQIDETLNTLHAQGDYGAIVVGIDNGGVHRLDEYSPWVNAQYGGGEGAAYMNFIAQTLKPYIDLNFRTKPQPEFNALIGSSMGALIATYGAVEHGMHFKKVGSFSPAYWFALSDLNTYVNATSTVLTNHRMYFVAGQNESATMVTNLNTVRNNLIAKGLPTAETFTKIDSYGTHTENYWKGEFAAAYQWLFLTTTLSNDGFVPTKPMVYQMTSSKLFVEGMETETIFSLFSITGQKVGTIKLSNGVHDLDNALASGIYFLKAADFAFKIFKN